MSDVISLTSILVGECIAFLASGSNPTDDSCSKRSIVPVYNYDHSESTHCTRHVSLSPV